VTESIAVDADEARRLRDAMTDKLVKNGWVTSPAIEAAFRAVPRHAFTLPGSSLESAYADDVIRTKFDASGTCLSSVSAPWLQAHMIRQAGVKAGMRVLEVGSGGFNAALLAEVTGPGGRVVSIDIDSEVTARAGEGLRAAGYSDKVEVVTGDGWCAVDRPGSFDAIIVTAGSWDVAPAWRSQLAVGGTIVVPLRLHGGWTRSIAFRATGNHLSGISAQVCGFVPLQGAGSLMEQSVAFEFPGGGHVLVRCENPGVDLNTLPADLFSQGPSYRWSGVVLPPMTSHSDLYLWLAGFERNFCHVTPHDDAALPGDPDRPGKNRYPSAVIRDRSLSYLTARLTLDENWEFGVCAYGPNPESAAGALLSSVADWNRHGRDLAQDAFGYWPEGATPEVSSPGPVALLPKRFGVVSIRWPAAQPVPT
jgi:protein-L-isoaspartate(D-aspartate) O-methyltransferase